MRIFVWKHNKIGCILLYPPLIADELIYLTPDTSPSQHTDEQGNLYHPFIFFLKKKNNFEPLCMLICFFDRILCLMMHWILFGLLIQILCDSVLWPIGNMFVGDLTFSSFCTMVQVYRVRQLFLSVVHWNRILLIFQKIKQQNTVRKFLYFRKRLKL